MHMQVRNQLLVRGVRHLSLRMHAHKHARMHVQVRRVVSSSSAVSASGRMGPLSHTAIAAAAAVAAIEQERSRGSLGNPRGRSDDEVRGKP